LGRILKKAAVVYFDVFCFEYCLASGTIENHENFRIFSDPRLDIGTS
jgi:hypothetical protein